MKRYTYDEYITKKEQEHKEALKYKPDLFFVLMCILVVFVALLPWVTLFHPLVYAMGWSYVGALVITFGATEWLLLR